MKKTIEGLLKTIGPEFRVEWAEAVAVSGCLLRSGAGPMLRLRSPA